MCGVKDLIGTEFNVKYRKGTLLPGRSEMKDEMNEHDQQNYPFLGLRLEKVTDKIKWICPHCGETKMIPIYALVHTESGGVVSVDIKGQKGIYVCTKCRRDKNEG